MTEMTSSYEISAYPGETNPGHHWSLIVAGEVVSEMWADLTTGEILQVKTPTAHQRNGYAGALYRIAAAQIDLFHAPASHRTYEGNRFAESVGGAALPCAYGCCDHDTEE